jgi:hypothetical protein
MLAVPWLLSHVPGPRSLVVQVVLLGVAIEENLGKESSRERWPIPVNLAIFGAALGSRLMAAPAWSWLGSYAACLAVSPVLRLLKNYLRDRVHPS